MTKKIKKLLSDSKIARWSALLIVSFTMMCGYFVTDVMAPLEYLLTSEKGWTSTDYGNFSGAYGWFNVFLFMLLLGGIILDKMGMRFTGIMACLLMFVGVGIKYWAISPFSFFTGSMDTYIFGVMSTQAVVAGVGFAIFGVGVEIAGITVTKIIVKWFTGHELALAMGLQVAMARIGTAVALGFSLPIVRYMGDISYPVLLGAVTLCIGLIFYLVYCVMDRKLDESAELISDSTIGGEEEKFQFRDLGLIVTNRAFWLISILCVLFYSGVFPFLKFATKLMIYKYNVNPDVAGLIPAMLPFGTILLTPIFGSLYDKVGKGATLMIIGSFMLIIVHLLFALPILNYGWFALIVMLILGIAFSLVPSAMWPAVPKIIPQKQLGSAYSIIFYVQNIGLMCVPMLIGYVIENYSKNSINGIDSYDYTIPMLIFTVFGLLALGVSILLKIEDKRKKYGLENPNM